MSYIKEIFGDDDDYNDYDNLMNDSNEMEYEHNPLNDTYDDNNDDE